MNLFIVSSGSFFSNYGGGQTYLKNLVDELIRKGFKPYIATPRIDVTEPKKYKNCSVIYFSQIPVFEEIKKLLQQINPDIVHAHGYKDLFAEACRELNIPCIITAHHGGIVCPAGTLLNQRDEICSVRANYENCIQCCVRDIPGGKFWLPFLKTLPVNIQLTLGRWLRKNRFIYFLTPLGTMALSIADKLRAVETIGKYATRLIAPSNAIADALIRHGVPQEKITIVPHGIPLLQRQLLRSDFGKGPMRFIFVGRISYVKGVHVMLEAFSQLKKDSYELHIAGGAVTKPEIHYMANLKKKYKSLNVIWHGNKPHQEIPNLLADCDVMIHPTICLEVYGLDIAEALAGGRPVIATRCGGAEMQIHDNENGILIPPNDASALRKAIKSTIEDPSLIQKLAHNESKVITTEQHVKDLRSIYETSMNESVMVRHS